MQKKEFKAESKRLLDIMINSIYTNKEIFLRELISNASDAIDKMYYKALTDSDIGFNKSDYFIRISIDKDNRRLTITDTGIGMTKEELESNLGTIAKSGSLDFKKNNEQKEDINIIGQFGVGFYSAFMVADKIKVTSRAFGEKQAFFWESEGAEGYVVGEADFAQTGTAIELYIKPDTDDEKYGTYLDAYKIKQLVKKYSDFIRYPIKMEMTKSRLKEGSKDEYEDYCEDETLNGMVPIWRKNKNELTDEDFQKFYSEKKYGYDKPLKHISINAEGTVSYRALLYIPTNAPFDFYTKEFQKGLELYSSGVLIMNKCADLLPDYFGFVQGLVDSENLSLNISRELLQHDRQLQFIAKRLRERVKTELKNILRDDREKYEGFFKNFGRTLKYGIYSSYGANREELEDLLLLYSSTQKKLITFAEYVASMKEEQKYIYFAAGESVERLSKLPQTESVMDSGFDILFLTDEVDEFVLRILANYSGKDFKSVSDSGDLGLNKKEEEEKKPEEKETNKKLFTALKKALSGSVKNVIPSKRLKTHPVCLSTEGGLSIEMEKSLKAMPGATDIEAQKVLEINTSHPVFEAVKTAFQGDTATFEMYAHLLYDQALLIEGLPVKDPVEFSNNICKLMK